MFLSRKVPSQEDLKYLDSWDQAFLTLTGHIEWLDPFDCLFFAQKAVRGHGSKEYLWGPEADLLSRTIVAAWRKVGSRHVKRIQAAFDLSGDISVSDQKLKEALKQSKKLGKQMWLACGKKVRAIIETTVERSKIHFDRQRAEVLKQITESGWEAALAAANTDHLQAYMTRYPDRILHPEVQRLADLTRTKPDARMIDKIQLRDRIEKIGEHGENYFANLSDVQVGRTWTNTGIQMAYEQAVTEYMVVSEADAKVCPVCRRLHGKHFAIEDAYKKMQQGMKTTDPDKLNKLFPFPRTRHLDNKSPKEIRAMGLSPPFHGKSYSADTEVYTNEGWKFITELRGDELFLSPNPDRGLELEWVRAKRLTCYNPGGAMVHFHSQNFSLLVTGDHDQIYSTRPWSRTGEWSVGKASDLAGFSKIFIPRCASWVGRRFTEVSIGKHSIPVNVFVRFMAYWLSDGSAVRTGKDSYYITIANTKSQDLVFETVLKLPVQSYKRETRIEFYDTDIGKYLMQFGRAPDKFVPSVIKEASPDIIKEFLTAYLVCDGHVQRTFGQYSAVGGSERRVFYTTSTKMASDLGECILKAGGYPSYLLQRQVGEKVTDRFEAPFVCNYDIHRVYWNESKTATFGQNGKGSIDFVPYAGLAYCVELEKNHVLWVRYKGKTCFSGNCRCDVQFLWREAQVRHIGADLGTVRMRPAPAEITGGKSGVMVFEHGGRKFFAKEMRFGDIAHYQREATAARAMHAAGLGEYTPRLYVVDGVFEGKTTRMIASELQEGYSSMASTEMYERYLLLDKTSDLVKERLVLQDYLMSAWDRSASNILIHKKSGAIKMIDYEMAFSSERPEWSRHALMQFLGKERIETQGPGGIKYVLRAHGKGGPAAYKFNKKVLQETIASADDVIDAIKGMDLPAATKKEWIETVLKRKAELQEFLGRQTALALTPDVEIPKNWLDQVAQATLPQNVVYGKMIREQHERMGISADMTKKIRSIFAKWGHGGESQIAARKEIISALQRGDEFGVALRKHIQFETDLYDHWANNKPLRDKLWYKSKMADIQADWKSGVYRYGDNWYEKDELNLALADLKKDYETRKKLEATLFRSGKKGVFDIESWTLNEEGAVMGGTGSEGLGWDHAITWSRMKDEGYDVLGGLSISTGAPGEGEVTLIKLQKIEREAAAVAQETFTPVLSLDERKKLWEEATKKGQFAVCRISDPKYEGKLGVLKDAKGAPQAFVQYRRTGGKFGKVFVDNSVSFGADDAWRANRIKAWKEAYRASMQPDAFDNLLISQKGVHGLNSDEMKFFKFKPVKFQGESYWCLNGEYARKWIDEPLPKQWYESTRTTVPSAPKAPKKPKVVKPEALIDSPEERHRICKEIADRGWTKYSPANLRAFEEGTEHIPIEVLDELNKKGLRARWIGKEEEEGAYFAAGSKEVVFGKDRSYTAVAHEVGHAVDNLATGHWGSDSHLWWNGKASTVNLDGADAEKLQKALMDWTKGKSRLVRRWGYDFYDDNAVDSYDLRSYSGEVGIEWWSMNSERYAKYRRRLVECDKKWLKLKEKYPKGIPKGEVAKVAKATKIEKEWLDGKITYQEMREKFAAEGSKWARARRCYGDALDVIEKAYLKPQTLVDDIDWIPVAD